MMILRKALLLAAVLSLSIGGIVYFLASDSDAETTEAAVVPSAVADVEPAQAADGKKNWVKRCEKNSDYCEIFQRLDVKESKKRLVEVAVGYPKDSDEARLAAILPLGLSLPFGMTLQVAGQENIKSEIKTCTEAGCVTFLNIKGSFLDAMKKNEKMTLVVKDSSGKQVNIVMTLVGFSEALKQL